MSSHPGPEDLPYLRSHFVELDILARAHGHDLARVRGAIGDRLLPAVPYVLEDGTERVRTTSSRDTRGVHALPARDRLERLLQVGLRYWRNENGDIYASRHNCHRGQVTIRFYGMV